MLAPGSGHLGQRAAAGCWRLAAWIWHTPCCGHLLLPSGPALGHSFSLCRLPAGGKAVNTAPVPGQTQQDESDRKTEPHSSVSDLVNSLTSEMLMVGPGVGRSSAVGLAAPPRVAACWLRPPSTAVLSGGIWLIGAPIPPERSQGSAEEMPTGGR